MTNQNGSSEKITNNPEEQRYELWIGEQVAYLAYEEKGTQITYLHTEVPEELEGQGIGSQLARFALDDARSQKHTVVSHCPFVTAYLHRHHEYLDLLTLAQRERILAD